MKTYSFAETRPCCIAEAGWLSHPMLTKSISYLLSLRVIVTGLFKEWKDLMKGLDKFNIINRIYEIDKN